MTDLGRIKKKAGVGRERVARHTEPAKRSDDDFITRIQLALNMSPRELADALDVPFDDVLDRYGPRAVMSSFVTDPFWQKLLNFVNAQLAGCMAVKDELDRKARVDQREHIARMGKMRGE
jgi:hypothetical protein